MMIKSLPFLLLVSYVRGTCDEPVPLSDKTSLDYCEDLLLHEGSCEGQTTFSIASSISKGSKEVFGEQSYDAELVTECVTGPLRFYRRINHMILNIRHPSDRSKDAVEKGKEVYPLEECSWNFFSESVISSTKEVVVRNLVRGKLHPFSNTIEVGDDTCKIEKSKVGSEEVDRVRAICVNSIWESDRDIKSIIHEVVRSTDIDICVNNDILIEKDSGIVLGKGKYCLTEIAGQIFIMTSDHLLIKPMIEWNMKGLMECTDKTQIDVIDMSKLESQERAQNRITRKDNEHICKVLCNCKGCDMEDIINKLNDIEIRKPGKFTNITLINDTVYFSTCYHDDLDVRGNLKNISVDRHSITLDALDILVDHLSKKTVSVLDGSSDQHLIPDHVISKDSLSYLSIALICGIIAYLLTVLMCSLKNTRRTRLTTEDALPMVEMGKRVLKLKG